MSDAYDAQSRRYTLTLRQQTAPTPGQPDKRPLPIPLAMALLGPDGQEQPTTLHGQTQPAGTRMLMLDQAQQDFVFTDVAAPPVASLLRGYSAPVRLLGLPPEHLSFLAAHDSDPFVRWESGQQYATGIMLRMVAAWRQHGTLAMDDGLLAALSATLDRADADEAFAAVALTLPHIDFVADQMAVADIEAIHAVRSFLRAEAGRRVGDRLRATYAALTDHGPYTIDGKAIGRRHLRNVCLGYLTAAPAADGVAMAAAQFAQAGNMTDMLAALAALANTDTPERKQALAAFHTRWHGDDLVLDKWFQIQAMSTLPDTLDAVRALTRHADFDLRNPNRVRAVVGAFANGNPVRFHAASGEGYRFLADMIMALDPLNGQVAARMVNPLGAWRRQDEARAALMRAELARIAALPKLSRFTYEKASKALAES